MNPPYGRVIGQWMAKAFLESQQGALVVCLIPARTDTHWWHDYAMRGHITFLRGRLKFAPKGHPGLNSAPFPSALVVFYPFGVNPSPCLPIPRTVGALNTRTVGALNLTC